MSIVTLIFYEITGAWEIHEAADSESYEPLG